MTFDVVQVYADMVKCRPVDLGNSLARRLRELEKKIRMDEQRAILAEWNASPSVDWPGHLELLNRKRESESSVASRKEEDL